MGLAAKKLEIESITEIEQLQQLLIAEGRVLGEQIVAAVHLDLDAGRVLNDLYLIRFLSGNHSVRAAHLHELGKVIREALITCSLDDSERILSYARGLVAVGSALHKI